MRNWLLSFTKGEQRNVVFVKAFKQNRLGGEMRKCKWKNGKLVLVFNKDFFAVVITHFFTSLEKGNPTNDLQQGKITFLHPVGWLTWDFFPSMMAHCPVHDLSKQAQIMMYSLHFRKGRPVGGIHVVIWMHNSQPFSRMGLWSASTVWRSFGTQHA